MWSSIRVDPDTYIPCYTGNMNYTRQFYTAYLWSCNILIDSPVGILCYRDYKYYTIWLLSQLLGSTWCYHITFMILDFIVYIVFYILYRFLLYILYCILWTGQELTSIKTIIIIIKYVIISDRVIMVSDCIIVWAFMAWYCGFHSDISNDYRFRIYHVTMFLLLTCWSDLDLASKFFHGPLSIQSCRKL